MKKIFALVFSLIILEQNSYARYTFDDENEDFNSWSSPRDSWNDDEDDYRSSSRKTSSWDDDDDYRSSSRKTSSWDDDDDLSYKTRYSYYDDDDDDLINPRSAKEQREIEEKREQRKKEKQLRKKQGKKKKREKALTNRRDQAAIDRIILDETPEDEKFDLLKDQLKLANTRMERYISKLKKKFTDPNLDFIERSFKFNNDSVEVLLENSRPEAKWKGKFLKEDSEFAENNEEAEEQILNDVPATSNQSTDDLQDDPEQITDENMEKINRMTREECQQKVKNGLIDKEYFFQLSLDNTKKINKAVKSIIQAVENRNGKTSQINKRKSMENAPKLRMLVALNSNLFKDVEFVRSIKNQLKVLGESIRESYEIASENGKKDHPYLKFLIVDKI